jgi:hypothetical protein
VNIDLRLPQDGECRCGQVRFRINAPPIMTAACHCTGCQRMSASAYSLTAMVPSTGFEVTSGEPVIGGLHGAIRHFFCPHCKSWMFTRPSAFAQFVNVRPTMLKDSSWFVPFIETYTSEKLPWVSTPAVHSFAKFPAMEDFGGLMAEFARLWAR